MRESYPKDKYTKLRQLAACNLLIVIIVIIVIIIIIVIIVIIVIIIIIIIITRPWPAFGRQGLDGSSGRYNSNW